MSQDKETFSINYENIINGNNLLAITKMLAVQLRERPYKTPGDFMKSLSDGDVQMLVDLTEREEDEHFAEFLLIAEMLAQAEGLERADEEMMMERVNSMIGFVVCESLARKGMVKVHHENMSFGEDMKNKTLVEKLF